MSWLKQSSAAPLYEDLLWSRPENKRHAGKLLIVGGHKDNFAAVAGAFSAAKQHGAGQVRVVVPDALEKTLKTFIAEASFAPSTSSGGFSKRAIAELTVEAEWADAVLIVGDIGRNSETAVVMERFSQTYKGLIVFARDACDWALHQPHSILDRGNTAIIATIAQLHKISKVLRLSDPITYSGDMLTLSRQLRGLTQDAAAVVVTNQQQQLAVAYRKLVSSTALSKKESDPWRTETAASVAVWMMQNPNKPFEAATTAAYQLAADEGTTAHHTK
jgi:ADP-dependent NAD(P)H-hydrate dehydratase / NAD(P)H-hydrate epimerase